MKIWMTVAASALALLSTGIAAAQNATPSTAQMIEQLKSTAPATATTPTAAASADAPAIKTRSLRNLAVRVAPGPNEAAATAPDPNAPAPEATTASAPEAPSLSLLIQFDFDSATVKTQSQPALENLALALKSKTLETSRFAIEGHTDAKGQAEYNRHLSQLRADAVRNFLAQRGVSVARLLTSGKGSSELATPDQPYSAQNRRVRIVNLD